ncbi:MAG: hypothetical protein KA792_10250 [Bacteroidales bacterium]|nr:hypothetical protein [Bacteroidales bacterium]
MFFNTKKNTELLRKAIKERSVITFSFMGHTRLVEPYMLGRKKDSDRLILCAWFLDGFTRSGFIDPNVRWRFYPVSKLRNIEFTERTIKSIRPEFSPEDCNFKEIIAKIEPNI